MKRAKIFILFSLLHLAIYIHVTFWLWIYHIWMECDHLMIVQNNMFWRYTLCYSKNRVVVCISFHYYHCLVDGQFLLLLNVWVDFKTEVGAIGVLLVEICRIHQFFPALQKGVVFQNWAGAHRGGRSEKATKCNTHKGFPLLSLSNFFRYPRKV